MDSHQLLLDMLRKKPSLLDEVARYANVTPQTVQRWTEGGTPARGETALLVEGFVRQESNTLYQPQKPTIPEAMRKGVMEKTFSLADVTLAAGYASPDQTLEMLRENRDPVGPRKARLEWYLEHHKIRPSPLLRQMKPEVVRIIGLIASGDKTLEEINTALGGLGRRLLRWLVGESNPTPEMLNKINRSFPERGKLTEPRPGVLAPPSIPRGTDRDRLESMLTAAASQFVEAAEWYLQISSPENRATLRKERPGLFFKVGNLASGLSSETALRTKG